MQFVRRIDDLGRVVIPRIIREKFSVSEGDSLEITMINEDYILINKTDKNPDITRGISEFTEEEQKVYDELLNYIKGEIEKTRKNIKELGIDDFEF